MENIRIITEGRVNIGAGTLYGAINILLDKGYIKLFSEELSSRKKKEYVITNEGKKTLIYELNRLEEMVKNGKELIK